MDLKNDEEAIELPTTPKMYANKLDDYPEIKRKLRPKTHFLTPSSSINSDTTRVDPSSSTENESGESIGDRSFTLTESICTDELLNREPTQSRFLLVRIQSQYSKVYTLSRLFRSETFLNTFQQPTSNPLFSTSSRLDLDQQGTS